METIKEKKFYVEDKLEEVIVKLKKLYNPDIVIPNTISFIYIDAQKKVSYGVNNELFNSCSFEKMSVTDFLNITDELEIGKWYVTTKAIARKTDSFCKDYGFNTTTGNWHPNFNVCNSGSWRLANKAELMMLEELFLAEAKNRYGEDWKNVKIAGTLHSSNLINKNSFTPEFDIALNMFWNTNGIIYNNGVWETELLSEPEPELHPFERVLVRDKIDEVWRCNIFSHKLSEENIHPYRCIENRYRYCIPFKGNHHLVGKR